MKPKIAAHTLTIKNNLKYFFKNQEMIKILNFHCEKSY